jgi:hypothetical protein
VVVNGCERKKMVVNCSKAGHISIVADNDQVQVFASSANRRKCVVSHAYTEYRHVAQSFALPICRRGPT